MRDPLSPSLQILRFVLPKRLVTFFFEIFDVVGKLSKVFDFFGNRYHEICKLQNENISCDFWYELLFLIQILNFGDY